MSNPIEPSEAAGAKEDPQTLVLRGKPRPVMRFRRGMIVGVTGAVAAGLITLSWFSLDPPKVRKASALTDGDEPAGKPVPDALANVPSSYGNVPRLGPPLPGDLGGPILEHERSLQDQQASASFNMSPGSEEEQARRDADQRLAAARQAALSSPVMVELQGPTRTGMTGAQQPQSDEVSAVAAELPAEPSRSGGLKSKASDVGSGADAMARALPAQLRLNAGTIISASLITGLNSDLPGTVIAQVTENVCDSATGRTILVPQGARLIGTYDSASAYGQSRALLVWKTIVFPDGSSVHLDNIAATDAAGFTGLKDRVNGHSWQLLKGIVLSSLLGVGTQLSFGNGESELVRAIRESTQQNASDAGSQMTSRNLDIRPTITVRPGWPVRAIVDKDLVLQPWRG